jgi:hypothetical protein
MSVPHVVQAGNFSQKIDRHTLHTKPRSVGRLWQKQEGRKSTEVGRGRRKRWREPTSAAYAVYTKNMCTHQHCQPWFPLLHNHAHG